MKIKPKFLLPLLGFALVLSLSGCRGWLYMPDTDSNDLWVSADPDIWFVGFNEEKGGSTGQLTSNGETIEVVMCWGPGPQFDIFRYPWSTEDRPALSDEDRLVRGSCKFLKDKGVVQVIEDKENLLGGVNEITFIREEIGAGEDGEDKGTVPAEQSFPVMMKWEEPFLCKGESGEYKVCMEQCQEDGGKLATSISVFDPSGAAIQSIEREDVTNLRNDRSPCLEDVNQDGYIDMVLPLYGTRNEPNVFYVWDPDFHKFEEVPVQAEDGTAGALCYYEIRDGRIATWFKRSVAETVYQEYEWVDGKTLKQVYEEVLVLEDEEAARSPCP